MSNIVTTCRQCGKEHEPSAAAIRSGSWRVCDTWSPKPASQSHCRECGRPIAGKRELCLRCLGFSVA
jgi:hypothetical protein